MNMRWAGYLITAFGLLNWRYQNSFTKGAPLMIFGLSLLIAAWVPQLAKPLSSKAGITIVGVLVGLMVILAFTN